MDHSDGKEVMLSEFLELEAEKVKAAKLSSYQTEDELNWPHALNKAMEDEFHYAALIKRVGVVEFSSAEWAGPGWVRLIFDDGMCLQNKMLPYKFERGMEVRVKDIVWVCDAPHGS